MRNISGKIEKLLKKGVVIPDQYNLHIGDEVDTGKISGNGVIIYPGCKIYGSSVLILDKVKIGHEGPVTLENCQVGPEVNLKGGFFKEAVFLKGASLGSGSHVREGTILEEEAGIAHTVGLKQTILFPYVTLGSLINFCDCFMSGGTSRKDHSEVGSSYIHFNYTLGQDKATPSLLGDVPNGVMLKQKPIFLGGQGGLVGPCRLAFGTTVAAGTICRKDELRPGRLLFGGLAKSGNIPYTPGDNRNIKRIITNNIIYIANLTALMNWYCHVRSQFISVDFPDALLEGLKEKLDSAVSERIKRLKEFYEKNGLIEPKQRAQSPLLAAELANELRTDTIPCGRSFPASCRGELQSATGRWPEFENCFISGAGMEETIPLRDSFLEIIASGIRKSGKDYLTVIKNLKDEESNIGTEWLQRIVDAKTSEALKILK